MSQAVYRSPLMLYIITAIGHTPRNSIPQIKLEMHTFESDYPFCSNPRCELHVRAGDTGVHGFGSWAHLPNGRIIGRGLYNGVFLCDPCGRAEIGVAVRTPTEAAA